MNVKCYLHAWPINGSKQPIKLLIKVLNKCHPNDDGSDTYSKHIRRKCDGSRSLVVIQNGAAYLYIQITNIKLTEVLSTLSPVFSTNFIINDDDNYKFVYCDS